MNARIAVLVLVSALFVAAWNSDQASNDENDPQVAARRARLNSLYNQRAIAFTQPGSGRPITPPREASPRETIVRNESYRQSLRQYITHTELALSQVHSASGRLIDLPNGITPGHYRVVDTEGQVDTIIIPGVVSSSDENLYQHDLDGERNYFIRIGSLATRKTQTADRLGSRL